MFSKVRVSLGSAVTATPNMACRLLCAELRGGQRVPAHHRGPAQHPGRGRQPGPGPRAPAHPPEPVLGAARQVGRPDLPIPP